MPSGRALSLLLVLALGLAAPSCRYSPWETDPDCTDKPGKNLASLALREAGGSDVRIALLTDSHNNVDRLDEVVSWINARGDIDFVIVLGDITNQGLLLEYEWACTGLRDLNAPRFYTIGNHDAISFGKEVFREMFGPYDLAFRFRNSRFILYNANKFEFSGVPDYDFIAAAAAVAGGETRIHTVAFSHVPPEVDVYTQAEVDFEEAFMAANGVDFTVHGHRDVYSLVQDGFGTRHLIVPSVERAYYSVLTLTAGDAVTVETCQDTCTTRASW